MRISSAMHRTPGRFSSAFSSMFLEYLGRGGETERQMNPSVPSIGCCEGLEFAGLGGGDTVPVS